MVKGSNSNTHQICYGLNPIPTGEGQSDPSTTCLHTKSKLHTHKGRNFTSFPNCFKFGWTATPTKTS